MLALIVAGGEGTRLKMGEKPLVRICDRSMISYVIEAFSHAGHDVVVVNSPRTPLTANWCRAQGIDCITAQGRGYVEDIVEAAVQLELAGSFFTSVSDIPCITPDIITRIARAYQDSDCEACSTWVPADICTGHDCRTSYPQEVGGIRACPAGINILLGSTVTEEQTEFCLVLHEPRLAFNINTREDLARAESFLCPEKMDI
jgi:adenosylcobinamide-phosphate guanylyltransferase